MRTSERLQAFVDRRWPDLAGPDPYDALNSPVIRRLAGRSRVRRIAWLQLVRRVPWDPRPLLRIRPHVNPKTVSLVARAYVRRDPARARRHLEWLESNATPGFSGKCWGYSFPWQSRRLWLDRGAPSAVCTAFVAHAFLDAFAAWGQSHHLDVALSASQFLLRDCPRRDGGISYIPGQLVLVHNANLLSASVLARAWQAYRSFSFDDELRCVAEEAVRFTLAEQRLNGAWSYDAASPRPTFVDGFHTALILESLDMIRRALGVDYSRALASGLDFYRRHLISSNGRPRRLLGRDSPTDIRDCAEAILVLGRFGELTQRDAVLRWTVEHMLDQRGFFLFESGRYNRIAFPRWQAWMLLALTDVECTPLRDAWPMA